MTTTLEPFVPRHAAVADGSTALRRFRPDIEGLRAVAVTIVVLSHLGLGFPGGYVGVDVFFVISGFLITRQLYTEYSRTGRISISGFYSRRAKRILPAATVVIVGTVLACRAWDSPLLVRTDAIDGLFSAFSGINWRLAGQGTNYFAIGTAPSPFQHYWSLSVEEQFYIVWPALLVAIGWLFGKRFGKRTSLIWTLLVVMAASLLLSVETTSSSPSWAYFGTQTRMWELAFGALLAVTVDLWTKMPAALASQMSWLGLIFIAYSCFAFGNGTIYPGSAVILPVVGSAFVIAGGCPGWPRSGELLLSRRPFQFVGNISYSWYLTHWPFLMVLPMALNRNLTTVDKWYVLFGSFILAVAMYYIVERPIRLQRTLLRRPSIALGMGGLLIAASVTVALVAANSFALPTQRAAATGTVAAPPDRIQQAVAVATSVKSLPVTTPSLTQASKDKPKTGNCLEDDTTDSLLPDNQCTFGDPNGAETIALVGDSHANQWEPAISAFGAANGYKVIEYAKAGCPPGIYPNYVDVLTNRIYTSCDDFRNQLFARLKVTKPRFVIVASELRTLDIDPSGMVAAIRNYQAAGARVIYLQDTPNALAVGAVPACLAKNASNIQRCALVRQASATRLEGFVQRRIEATAAVGAGASIVDPAGWFCTDSVCPPIINDMIVYADDSHITATYAAWLSPLMSTALKNAIG